jgi:hypothetical protein
MRRAKLLLVVAMVGVGVLFASAVSASVLFQDNFETGTLGSQPVAAVGSWAFALPAQSTIVNANPPGAASGSQYLSVARGATWTEADPVFARQSTNGDLVRLDLDVLGIANTMMYGADYPNPGAGDDIDKFFLLFNADGSLTGNPGVISGVTYTTGAWNHVRVDYTVGAANYNLTVGSQTASVALGGTGAMNAFLLLNSGGAGYFDNVTVSLNPAVPEPASVVLLVSAMLGLVAYAWRKRR